MGGWVGVCVCVCVYYTKLVAELLQVRQILFLCERCVL